MQDMEKTVAVTQPDSVSVDAVQDQATEETRNELEQFLSSVEDEAHEADANSADTNGTERASEAEHEVPKGIKGRIQAAEAKADKLGYERGRDEAMRELETYKQQMAERFKKLEEFELEQEAKALAEQEKCSIGIARRLIRAEKGLPAQEKAPEAPARDEKGRFSVRPDNDLRVKAETLMKQANDIKSLYGADVLETFRNDKTVQQKVGSGEWDMRDVYIHMLSNKKQASAEETNTPAPVRSGGAQRTVGVKSISDLNRKGLDALNESIRKGKTYRFD